MEKIRFTKMQGCANDYIYLDCMKTPVPANISELAIGMSRRHFSVGSDGIICVCSPEDDGNDARMRMFNADGGEGRMCGNGIRCVAKFLWDKGYIHSPEAKIETLSGVKQVKLILDGGDCTGAEVEMGSAEFECAKIPVIYEEKYMISRPIDVLGREYIVTAVSMGNPHCVVFTDEGADKLMNMEIDKIGPHFERHERFPERVNTEFAAKTGRNEFAMRVWERGSGETYACGTGACALAAAAVKTGLAEHDTPIKITLLGGELEITVRENYEVIMQGPAKTIYEGEYYVCG